VLDLTFDQVLTTTRSVRKRLDLERPVPRTVVEECLQLALQAPSGSNQQPWRWIAVDDPGVRAAVAAEYAGALDGYAREVADAGASSGYDFASPEALRIGASVYHLRDHLHRVPVLVVPLVAGRLDGASVFLQASLWGSVLPATWSFMLALRSRGLGSAWTTVHLHRERRVAEILGVPFERWTQAGLLPVAYTVGTGFKPGPRRPASEVLRWNGWA
jgi:nitroreductase